MPEPPTPAGPESERAHAAPEPVWSYRGYQLRAGEFTTAMAHFYRAEVQRANVWRQRLDTTTNWAVLTTGAAISFAFSRALAEDHRVIILDTLLVTLFLWIETRRDRYYELWSYRVRLMETDFFATMLVPPFQPAADWGETLAESLLHPQFPVSLWEALGRRFRRNYFWIYAILALAWVAKVWLQPSSAETWSQFVSRAAVGSIPGSVVLIAGTLLYGLLFLIGLLTIGLQKATGEVLPRYGSFRLPTWAERLPGPARRLLSRQAWFRPSRRRQQLLAFIVTARTDMVSDRILHQLKRGVTVLPATGAYTQEPKTVLMCALTVTEVAHLKALVSAADPHAFVMLSPAQEVLGMGFNPLQEEDTASS